MNDLECINNPTELLGFMEKNIKYGFISDISGEIHTYDNKKKFQKAWQNYEYSLQNAKKLIQTKYGVCWDMVELERLWFKTNNYEFKTMFLWFGMHETNNFPTHTFLIYKQENKFYWFEYSFEAQKGIHEFSSEEEAIDYVKEKQLEFAIKNSGATKENKELIEIYEFKDPTYGCNAEEYWKNIVYNKSNKKK